MELNSDSIKWFDFSWKDYVRMLELEFDVLNDTWTNFMFQIQNRDVAKWKSRCHIDRFNFWVFFMYEAVNLNNGIRLGGFSKWYLSLLYSANQRRPFRFCVSSRPNVLNIISKSHLSFEKIGYECKIEEYLKSGAKWTVVWKWTVLS